MTSAASDTSHSRLKAEGFATAPLIEAVIDVHFADPIVDDELARLRDALSEFYPAFHSTLEQELLFDAGSQSVQVSGGRSQFQGAGHDTTELSLLRPNGLAASQLAPYRDWDSLYGRFRRDLESAFKLLGERPLSRMAVRSINRIDVPADEDGILRYEHYIAVHPQLPAELDPLIDFQLSLVRDEPEVQATAKIGIGGFPQAVKGGGSFVVDIDLFRTKDVPSKLIDLDVLFSQFRDVKNRLYRNCLTPRALEDFK